MNKIQDGLKIPANCSGVRVSILNEAVAKNRKIMPFRKRAVERLTDIQSCKEYVRSCGEYFTHFLEGKDRWNSKTHP